MLKAIMPYESEPIRVSPSMAVTCEVWFVDDADDLLAAVFPPALVPELATLRATRFVS